MNHPDGEGPVVREEARARAKAERSKPEHAYRIPPGKDHDPRDRAHDADLDHQEKDQ